MMKIWTIIMAMIFVSTVINAQSTSIRGNRKNSLTLEGGWNSLAGTGVNYMYSFNSNFALDFGAGIGLQGVKGGIRAQYYFLKKDFSPYMGLGYIINPLTIPDLDLIDEMSQTTQRVNILPAHFTQIVLGLEYRSKGGFVIGSNLGYARLLKNNIEPSDPRDELIENPTLQAIKILYGSGLAVSFNIGYAF